MGQEMQNIANTSRSDAPSVEKNDEERISDVQFELDLVNSEYLKPMRLHFTRRQRKSIWDMAIEHDNVAAIIYHTEWKQLLLVKQFRPPVFIHAVRTRPENAGKTLEAIEWEKYPLGLGETLELCAGLMDKPGKSSLEHIQEEILEECGYQVPADRIESVKRYVTGISISGAAQHLFYARIDESMKATEGGGNTSEGEFIKKVFLSAEEIQALLKADTNVSPPSMLFALFWWIRERCEEKTLYSDNN